MDEFAGASATFWLMICKRYDINLKFIVLFVSCLLIKLLLNLGLS